MSKYHDIDIKTIIEPFQIRSVEPIKFTTSEERRNTLANAGYNPFLNDLQRTTTLKGQYRYSIIG